MSITNNTEGRTITAIFNPTIEEIETFFGQSITDKIEKVKHERILSASIATNDKLGLTHYSLSLTTNNSEMRQNTQSISWVVEK